MRALVTRPLGILLRVAAVLLPLLLIGLGVLYVRLMYNPVSVAFLAGPIERALNGELPGFAFGIGDAVLQRADGGGIEFRLKDVRMNDSGGGVVALARFAAIEIDPKALLAARLAPSRIDLIEPRFLVFFDEQGALSLKPPAADEGTAAPRPAGPAAPAAEPRQSAPAAGTAPEATKLEVVGLISQALGRLRREGQAASYLKDFGFKNATLIIDDAGRQHVWRIPEVDIDLQHKQKRSILVGRAVVNSAGDPWMVKFRAEDSDKSRSLIIKGEFENVVPHSLARQIPALSALAAVEAPVKGQITLDVGLGGGVNAATANLDIGRGAIGSPWPGGPTVGLTSGRVDLRYDGATGTLEMLPSPLTLSPGRMTLVGRVAPAAPLPSGEARWRFAVEAKDGQLNAVASGAQPIAIEQFSVTGHQVPASGVTIIDRLQLKAGTTEIEMATAAPDPANPSRTDIEGRFSPTSVTALLAVWPMELAPRTRSYLATNVRKGQIRGGSFRIGGGEPGNAERRLSLSIEAQDVELELAKGLPPLEIPRTLVRLEGSSIEVTIPDAGLTAQPGKRLTLKGGRYTAVGIDSAKPLAEVAGRIQGALPVALDLMDREPLKLLRGQGLQLPPGIDGKLDAQLRAAFPVGETVAFSEARFEGKVRITDGRVRNIIGTHDISGATIAIDATDKQVDVKGEMLLAGVVAKLQGRLPIGQGEGAVDVKSPLARVTLRVDDADRQQLGLDLDRLVKGDVPLEILVYRTAGEQLRTHVVADLTSAELMLDEMQWRKLPGRPAKLEFDLGKDQAAKGLELQNFRLDGENIAIDGWVGLGPEGKARAFLFPEFVLNVISSLEVQGTLRADRVWEVRARAKTPFDAGEVFRAMLVLDRAPVKPSTKERPGLDLVADLDTVLGLNDLRLRHVRLAMRKKNDHVTEIDFKGVHDSGRPIKGVLRPEPGKPRIMRIDTEDAGQALKLIGFYQNMVGGSGVLSLNLDGGGAAETHGSVVIRNFRVLGDPIASEVFQTPDESQPVIAQARPTRRVLREQFDFELLNATFSVGNGQLIIDNATARGPVIGASLRGKLDFRSRRLDLGGTYVPLSGLNRSLSGVPVLSELLTGPRGEGVLGITFAVNGPMSNPQVIFNPLSPFAPGVLRELTQMTPDNPTITPRAEPKKAVPKGAGPQIRASPPTGTPEAVGPSGVPSEVIGGWSTTAREAPAGKKK